MPQYRRKVAFSTKKKKEQLKAKREKKRNILNDNSLLQKGPLLHANETTPFESPLMAEVEEINASSSTRNRYCLKFKKGKKIETTVKLHHIPLKFASEDTAEVSTDMFYVEGLDYPKRPQWSNDMSKSELDQSENKYFRLFCEDLDKNFTGSGLSLYELNLETWRQLWRVIEMSDILLIIVDARFPIAQFPPYLYKYLVNQARKKVILILNKCDLLPPELVIAWQDFFTENYPSMLVLPFTTAKKSRCLSAWRVSPHCLFSLVDACERMTGNEVDLDSWREKIKNEIEVGYVSGKVEISGVSDPAQDNSGEDILSIGTIGNPNVGKSSFINSVMGKKVVSISKTPGHTKHFQTIFLTANIRLVDCPGLVFPSICPKELQVLIGSYPIAQVRDPISCIHYIASRLTLPRLLNLKIDYLEQEEDDWTAFFICEAWAKKRGYFVRTKGGKADVSRAANELLRYTLVGHKSLIISMKPPGYFKRKGNYATDPRIAQIESLKVFSMVNSSERSDDELSGSSSEEEIEEAVENESGDKCQAACSFSVNRFALLECDT